MFSFLLLYSHVLLSQVVELPFYQLSTDIVVYHIHNQSSKVDKAVVAVEPPNDQSGIFRIRVSGISSAKNLLKPELDYTRVDLEVQWEPRLTPISIDMPMSTVKILDVDGNELKVSNPDQVLSGTVQAGINQVEMSVVLENIDREVKTIGEVTGRLKCVLPCRPPSFGRPWKAVVGRRILLRYLTATTKPGKPKGRATEICCRQSNRRR